MIKKSFPLFWWRGWAHVQYWTRSILGSNIPCCFFRLVKNFLDSHNAVRSCCWGIGLPLFDSLQGKSRILPSKRELRDRVSRRWYLPIYFQLLASASWNLCRWTNTLSLLRWSWRHCPVEVGFAVKMGGSAQEERSLYFFTVELVVNCGNTACGTAGGRRLKAAGSTWKGGRLCTTSIAGDRWLLLRQIERFLFLERPVEKVWREACKPQDLTLLAGSGALESQSAAGDAQTLPDPPTPNPTPNPTPFWGDINHFVDLLSLKSVSNFFLAFSN